jgi:hypothetical protein
MLSACLEAKFDWIGRREEALLRTTTKFSQISEAPGPDGVVSPCSLLGGIEKIRKAMEDSPLATYVS